MQSKKSTKVDTIIEIFNKKYYYEELRKNPGNKDLIKDFSGGKFGKGEFLKESGLEGK